MMLTRNAQLVTRNPNSDCDYKHEAKTELLQEALLYIPLKCKSFQMLFIDNRKARKAPILTACGL